jgi:hypothetical protein
MKGLLEQVAHKLHKTEEQIAHLRWFYKLTYKLAYLYIQ